jgi:hypothetical protein
MEREQRTLMTPIEARKAEGQPTRLVGYASRFNSETVIAGFFRERVAPGAFADALGKSDVRALFNHDANYVLGRNLSGTLRLAEDTLGLQYDVTPPDTAWARDLMVSVERGDISGSSFAFTVETEEWDYPKGQLPLRTIIKIEELFDTSVVTYPAYESATVSARAMDAAKKDTEAAVRLVREQAERVLNAARLRWAKAKADAA